MSNSIPECNLSEHYHLVRLMSYNLNEMSTEMGCQMNDVFMIMVSHRFHFHWFIRYLAFSISPCQNGIDWKLWLCCNLQCNKWVCLDGFYVDVDDIIHPFLKRHTLDILNSIFTISRLQIHCFASHILSFLCFRYCASFSLSISTSLTFSPFLILSLFISTILSLSAFNFTFIFHLNLANKHEFPMRYNRRVKPVASHTFNGYSNKTDEVKFDIVFLLFFFM